MERVIDIRFQSTGCRFVGVEIDEPIIVIHGGVSYCRGCSDLLALPSPIRGFYKGHLVDDMRNWEDEVMYAQFYKCQCGENLMSMRVVCGKEGFTADALFKCTDVEVKIGAG